MKKLVLMIALLSGSMMAVGATRDDPKKMAADAVAQWNAVLNSGSVDALMRLYADNAMVLLPNGQAATNSKSIREFWKHLLANTYGKHQLDLDDVIFVKDDTIVSTVRWSNLEDGLKYSYEGVIYNLFKRQPDGSWKAQVQRWN